MLCSLLKVEVSIKNINRIKTTSIKAVRLMAFLRRGMPSDGALVKESAALTPVHSLLWLPSELGL